MADDDDTIGRLLSFFFFSFRERHNEEKKKERKKTHTKDTVLDTDGPAGTVTWKRDAAVAAAAAPYSGRAAARAASAGQLTAQPGGAFFSSLPPAFVCADTNATYTLSKGCTNERTKEERERERGGA